MPWAIEARVAQPPLGACWVFRSCYRHSSKNIILHAHKPGVYRTNVVQFSALAGRLPVFYIRHFLVCKTVPHLLVDIDLSTSRLAEQNGIMRTLTFAPSHLALKFHVHTCSISSSCFRGLYTS